MSRDPEIVSQSSNLDKYRLASQFKNVGLIFYGCAQLVLQGCVVSQSRRYDKVLNQAFGY